MNTLNNSLELFFLVLLGLIIGSFLNVCIVRIPRNQSIISPPSHCPACGQTLKWWHNIPLLSFLILRGRCYYCRQPISIRYPLVELLTAVLLVAVYVKYGISYQFFVRSVFLLFLIIIAFIDYEHFLIFDIVIIPAVGAGIILALFPFNTNRFVPALTGLIVAGGMLFLIRLLGNQVFKKETMGLGDIKLAALVGVFLGWKQFILTVFIASVLILIVAGIQKLVRYKKYTGKFPFATYISLAAVISLFYGTEIIDCYLNIFLTG